MNNDADDDDVVSNIVNSSSNSGNISSISGSSTRTTASDSSSMVTIPTEYNDGLFDGTLFSGGKSFLHYYGTGHDHKKVFFNVYKFNKHRNPGFYQTIVNIKVKDYIIYKNSLKSKTRFVFAGILTKYTDYLKHLSDPTHKLTSKFLV